MMQFRNIGKTEPIMVVDCVQGGDPHGDGGEGGDKITEWQAAWNVTNAIQVPTLSQKRWMISLLIMKRKSIHPME
jgi:hypothetical protein